MRKILNAGTFGLAGKILGGGGKKKAAPAATPPERVMPLPDDEAVARARKASMFRQANRSGRASTILTSPGSTMGG
jgi:hypothetical protein